MFNQYSDISPGKSESDSRPESSKPLMNPSFQGAVWIGHELGFWAEYGVKTSVRTGTEGSGPGLPRRVDCAVVSFAGSEFAHRLFRLWSPRNRSSVSSVALFLDEPTLLSSAAARCASRSARILSLTCVISVTISCAHGGVSCGSLSSVPAWSPASL